MGVARLVLFSCMLTVAGAGVAAAQVLSVNTSVVTPGATVTLSITGPAGHSFAIIGSTVGSGFSYAGVPLAVGPDVVIHTTGVIGGGGTATVGFTPPFGGSSLDRYYIQLATSPTPAFSTIQASNGIVLRNADAVAVPSMGPGVVGSVLSSPTFSAMASAVFTASRNLLCVVSSSVQIDPNVALPLGTDFGFMRNAIQRNGDTTNDNVYGHYITSNGLTTRQPVISRTSSFVVVAGDVVRFGVYLGDVPA
ncbi:MAG: hypothetical protein IT178_11125, partial [Acidobacteria bacterium]|nr:hypothetical protein [Acidobacteriota bacterium]